VKPPRNSESFRTVLSRVVLLGHTGRRSRAIDPTGKIIMSTRRESCSSRRRAPTSAYFLSPDQAGRTDVVWGLRTECCISRVAPGSSACTSKFSRRTKSHVPGNTSHSGGTLLTDAWGNGPACPGGPPERTTTPIIAV